MVRGLARFKERLGAYADQYILIGGAACDLLMDEAGLTFRATKDLDIVLCVEALRADFVAAFWEFVKEGQYGLQQGAEGKARYYRFMRPKDAEYPQILELFSRRPDGISLPDNCHLTPIPIEEAASSLSAILMDEDYYAFLHAGRRVVDGVPIVGPEQLIVLKAKAWLDLTARRAGGEQVDEKDITKHKNDVFRMYRVLEPTVELDIPERVRADVEAFLGAMVSENVDLKALEILSQTKAGALEDLRRVFVRR